MPLPQIILCILDGLGCSKSTDITYDAFKLARTPNFDKLFSCSPCTQLEASGGAVGLPEGQMGNSEVGHMTIGSGRAVLQDFPRINNAIANSEILQAGGLHELLRQHVSSECKKKNTCTSRTCHLLGMLSDGGVHSHIDHIIYLADFLAKHNISTKLHLITDGRDVLPRSATVYINRLQCELLNKNPLMQIATISGRYYAMDRDNRLVRTKLAVDAIMFGISQLKFVNLSQLIEQNYQNGVTDEFFVPSVNEDYRGVEYGDTLLVANFRADRIRQVLEALVQYRIVSSMRHNSPDDRVFSCMVGMMHYSDLLDKHIVPIFPTQKISGTLGNILASHNKTQLRLAETEKYAHVTYFFNCGQEVPNKGESGVLIPSPQIATYDLKPAMSAYEITECLINAIQSQKYDFICVNFANADMVGHTGNIPAAIKACEVLDECVGRLTNMAQQGVEVLITSDHGNVECMFNEKKQQPHTSHTTNLVPFIYVGDKKITLAKTGTLADIAPTVLELLGIKRGIEMTGKSLFLHF
ncbi:2,3-bisphosphoglycerate-independent phosphoglycerate mutase [Alphaproteobacteria bacterium]